MKTLKKYASLLMLFTLLIGFTSCEDEEDLEDKMFGRVWVGNIGMDAENNEPIYSEFTFDPDGFGEEYQYYKSDNEYYANFRFQWNWSNRNELVLDYGRYGISYMRGVDIRHGRMTGVFYFTDHSAGFPFTLDMQ